MAFRAIFWLFLCVSPLWFVAVHSLGGIRHIPSSEAEKNQELQKALQYGMSELNKQANNYYQYMKIEVLDATEQVVAGIDYCIVAAIGSSSACPKGQGHEEADLDECPVEKKEMECRFMIWSKPWLSYLNVTKRDCLPTEDVEIQGPLKCPGGGRKVKREAPSEDYQKTPESEEEIRFEFNKFVEKYDKEYQQDEREFEHRYGIFKENLDLAKEMQHLDRGTARYGITQFSDLTPKEFCEKYTMNGWGKPLYELKEAEIPNLLAPESFDWRDHGAVTEVKNQGSCGSCWAFSTTGNIEGQWAIAKKKLISLSEQELVDCDTVDQGCNGGLPSNAYKQIMKLGGLESEAQYPYTGRAGKCKFNKQDFVAYINGSVKISQNEDDMAAWLTVKGPISIGINANAMQFYLGGVAHPWKIFCNPANLDHGVLIVGYGVKSGTPYWIIKNSWGESWGVQGYYLIYRGDGSCGLNTMCTSSVVD